MIDDVEVPFRRCARFLAFSRARRHLKKHTKARLPYGNLLFQRLQWQSGDAGNPFKGKTSRKKHPRGFQLIFLKVFQRFRACHIPFWFLHGFFYSLIVSVITFSPCFGSKSGAAAHRCRRLLPLSQFHRRFNYINIF